MQKLQNFFVRLDHSCLVIGNPVFLAEQLDNFLRFPQVIAWHTREKVVFDLVIQSAVPKVVERARIDIASGQHLPPQEVYFAALFQDRHAFVIRRND